MEAVQQILLYVMQTIGGLYLFVALMRVLLQASRADYYNPVSQFVIKATQAPVSILGKVIPTYKQFDLAAIIWVLLVHLIIIEASALAFGTYVNPTKALAWSLIGSLEVFLTIIFWGMIIIIIMSFAALLGGMMIQHPILDLIRQLMTPIMYPLQKVLPPMGGIDLSPILLFMLINVFKIITYELAVGTDLIPNFVIGF